jgi:hypothetical protein
MRASKLVINSFVQKVSGSEPCLKALRVPGMSGNTCETREYHALSGQTWANGSTKHVQDECMCVVDQ